MNTEISLKFKFPAYIFFKLLFKFTYSCAVPWNSCHSNKSPNISLTRWYHRRYSLGLVKPIIPSRLWMASAWLARRENYWVITQFAQNFAQSPRCSAWSDGNFKITYRHFSWRRSFLEAHKHSLYEALAVFCQRRLGKPLPTDSWELTNLPSHWLMNFRLLDTHNQFLTMGRDLVKL